MTDRTTRVGLSVVGLTAIAWSFLALSDLARLCGITTVITVPWVDTDIHIAWGLPLTVDVLAVVATRVWLQGAAPADALVYARRAAWGAIGATILGNAYHGVKASGGPGAIWEHLDALIVSATPAVVIGVIVHLAVLVGRGQKPLPTPAPPPGPPPSSPPGGEDIPPPPPATAAQVETWEEQAWRLVREAAGRKRIRRELDISEHYAREISKPGVPEEKVRDLLVRARNGSS